MGIIAVDVWGSFKTEQKKRFSAEDSGHAVAAENAIRFLTDEVLKSALAQDRKLRLGKDAPKDGWAEFDKRHPMSTEPPADVIAEKVFHDQVFGDALRFSHCNFVRCVFRTDCIFTDCLFEDCTVKGELLKCNLMSCDVLATVFLHCQAKSSDVTVCHIKPSWEDSE